MPGKSIIEIVSFIGELNKFLFALQWNSNTGYFTRRTCHDTLELSEISLDINLIDNHVRYKFADSPVLAVSIFETQISVVILVVTVSSLHRLTYTHPRTLQQKVETQSMSIFHEASANSTRDASQFHVIGNLTGTSTYIGRKKCFIQLSKTKFSLQIIPFHIQQHVGCYQMDRKLCLQRHITQRLCCS